MFRRTDVLSDDGLTLVEAWFWLSMYSEFFFGLSASRVTTTIDDVCKTSVDLVPRWSGTRAYNSTVLRKRFDFRHARAKGLALLLASGSPLRLDGGSSDCGALFKLDVIGSIGHLVPRTLVTSAYYSHYGNRVLLAADEMSNLQSALAGGSVSEAVLESHLIPLDAAQAAKNGEWDQFIDLRAKCVEQKTADHAKEWSERYQIDQA